ncbi:MAG: SDR family oxidoreductase [Bacteroidales bacterium]
MKTALVTGGNRGIGLEICRQLDGLGFQVILGSRDLGKGLRAARGLSPNVIVRQLDVTDEKSMQRLFDFVQSGAGQLDVLINNAGLGTDSGGGALPGIRRGVQKHFNGLYQMVKKSKPLLEKAGVTFSNGGASTVPLEQVRHTMETNLFGPWRMAQLFIPLLLGSDSGRIVNISSGMGQLTNLSGDSPAYRMSKSSLNILTLLLARELAGTSIRVNSMCPGWVRTDMGGPDAPRSVEEGADTAVWLATAKEIPSGRFFKDRNVIDW